MGITINPSDSNTYLIHTNTSANVTLTVAEIKAKIGTGNFILYWSSNAYYVARLNNTENDVYLCDTLHVGLSDDDDRIFINGTGQKESYKYGYDQNSGTFVIVYGSALNFSAKSYSGKSYIYYPVSNTDHPQIGVFTSYGTLYINNAPVVQYVWTSVPTISGNSETHTLAQVDSESINDGEPVSDLVASDFIALPDAIKVKALADARVRE